MGKVIEDLFRRLSFISAIESQASNREVHLPELFDGGFLDIEEIERVITYNRIILNNLSMSKDEAPIEKHLYSDGTFIDSNLLQRQFERGASIIIRAAHRFFPGVAEIVDGIGEAWGCNAQGNLYISLAGVNATYPHFDPHELYIFQILGEKRWDLFEGSYVHPEHDDGFDSNRHPVGKMDKQINLRRGDVLFLPRGRLHRPVAVTPSIHLAVGLKGDSLAQVLRKCVQVVASLDEEFRALAFQGKTREETGIALADVARRLITYLEDEEFRDRILDALDVPRSDSRRPQSGWLTGALETGIQEG